MTREQLGILKALAAENNYGRGLGHAKQVRRLSLKIYEELVRLNILESVAEDKQILEAATLLHDIGVGEEPHNEIAFAKLLEEIPKRLNAPPLPLGDFSAVLYCVLFHRGHKFSEEKGVPMANPGRTKRLAAIVRIADGLDWGPPFDAPVQNITLMIVGETMTVWVEPVSEGKEDRVKKYAKHTIDRKVDLFREAFAKQIAIEVRECAKNNKRESQ